VSQNSTVKIQDSWSSGLRNIMNVVMGKVRFFISTPGGNPNPIRVGTPTALIAVRGTTFDVAFDPVTGYTEVVCLQGRVGVESREHNDREVILDPNTKTQVRPGLPAPLAPIAQADPFPPRTFNAVKKNPGDTNSNIRLATELENLNHDGDRSNRPAAGNSASPSQMNSNVDRAKGGTVTFP
jgi:hypothetical protein